MSEPSRRIVGSVAVGAGIATSAAVYLAPGGLNAPAWVAHLAASVFVFAGLALIAAELKRPRLRLMLVAAALTALGLVGASLAFAPGRCSVSLPLLRASAPNLACRFAFGAGALIVAGMIACLIRSRRSRRN